MSITSPDFQAEAQQFFKEFNVLKTPMTVQHIKLAIEHGYMLAMHDATRIATASLEQLQSNRTESDSYTEAKWQGHSL